LISSALKIATTRFCAPASTAPGNRKKNLSAGSVPSVIKSGKKRLRADIL
jgi:hypothetical protein